ncbi:MAG: hypothetical protein RR806_09210 [Oscillospiraceae bacterium]
MKNLKMKNLKTVRGQSVRIAQDKNGLFSIELYANGKWEIPASGYNKKFKTATETEEFFEENRCCIHS